MTVELPVLRRTIKIKFMRRISVTEMFPVGNIANLASIKAPEETFGQKFAHIYFSPLLRYVPLLHLI